MRQFCLTFLFLAAGVGWSQTYVNPLTGSTSTPDPSIIKQGNTYYIFHTGNGVQIKTSTDRITWSNGNPASAISTAPSWHATYVSPAPASQWAPAIHYRAGKYWLYYAISSFGTRTSAIGLRTNVTLNPSDANYAWQDQGMVVCTSNQTSRTDCFYANTTSVNADDTTAFNAIDPHVFVDGDGTPWLSWGSFGSGIQLIRLDPVTGKPAAGAKYITIAHRYYPQAVDGSNYTRSIEGPMISKHGPWYYLWFSYDRCCNSSNSTYKVMVARAPLVTGPYADKSGNPMHPPYYAAGSNTTWVTANAGTLVSAGDTRWKGTGHNDILVDNDTVFLVNHSYDAQNGGATRLMIRPLYWDAQGWPSLDPAQGTIKFPTVVLQEVRFSHRAPVKAVWKNGVLVPWRGGTKNALGRNVRTGIPPARK
jgi:arabinan endo-1,5-alpha-L-arabinosidase